MDEVEKKQHKDISTRLGRGLVVGIVVAVIFGIWYNHNNNYNTAFNNNFMNSCEAQGPTASYCSCALNQLEADYSYDQAKAYNASPYSSEGQIITSTISDDCASYATD